MSTMTDRLDFADRQDDVLPIGQLNAAVLQADDFATFLREARSAREEAALEGVPYVTTPGARVKTTAVALLCPWDGTPLLDPATGEQVVEQWPTKVTGHDVQADPADVDNLYRRVRTLARLGARLALLADKAYVADRMAVLEDASRQALVDLRSLDPAMFEVYDNGEGKWHLSGTAAADLDNDGTSRLKSRKGHVSVKPSAVSNYAQRNKPELERLAAQVPTAYFSEDDLLDAYDL